jgi:hypothetical protein
MEPDYSHPFSIEHVGIYAWHTNHHLAPIEQTSKFKGDI